MKKLDPKTVYFIMAAGHGFLNALIFTVNMVYQAATVGLNPLQLVLVGTTLEASVFIFEIPTGVVADVYSRRLSVIIGIFMTGLGFLLEGSIPTFAAVLLAQVVWGVGWTFISGARAAWIADEVGPETVGPLYLRGAQLYQVGHLAGIGVSVALGSLFINLPILTGGALFLLLGIFLVIFMPETGFKPASREGRSAWGAMTDTLKRGVKLVKARPSLLTILTIGLFFGLYSEGFDRLWTPHLLENFTFPTIGGLKPVVWFGIMSAGSITLSIVATEMVLRRVDTTKPLVLGRVLQIISIGIVACIVSFGLVSGFPLALAFYLAVGMLRSAHGPLTDAWLNQYITDSQVRATALSVGGQVDALGQVIGGPIVGAIGTIFSLRAALVAAALILSPVWWLYGRVVGREEKMEESLES